MKLPQDFDTLISVSQTERLYEKLVEQLNKDLRLANVDLEFDQQTLPTSLKYLLQDSLFQLINQKFIEYLNLLYIVDVSEERVRQFDTVDVAELSEQVAFLILQREWQKVWYRNLHSSP